MTEPPRSARDRDVVALMALVVGAVLALNVISAVIPGMDDVLSSAPVLVILLVVATGGVLLWSAGRRRGSG